MLRRWWTTAIAVALVSLMVLPVAAADQGGTNRPFKARFTGEVTWQFPGESASGCEFVTTNTLGSGKATHMGRTTSIWSHCPAEEEYVLDGRLILVAANGDELHGIYDYGPEGDDRIPITLAGGTGRFAEASGLVVATYHIVPQLIPGCDDPESFACLDFAVPWPWQARLRGTINR